MNRVSSYPLFFSFFSIIFEVAMAKLLSVLFRTPSALYVLFIAPSSAVSVRSAWTCFYKHISSFEEGPAASESPHWAEKPLERWRTQFLLAQSDGLWADDLQKPETEGTSSCSVSLAGLFKKKPDRNPLGNTNENNLKHKIMKQQFT